MSVKSLQETVRDLINADAALSSGGCVAIAESSMTLEDDLAKAVNTLKGVALVVTTPDIRLNGCAENFIPCDATLAVRCVEIPALRKSRGESALTALEAAERVAVLLNGPDYNFVSISETLENRQGYLVATATFNTTLTLS